MIPDSDPVFGQHAPSPRLTPAGAALLALGVALPGGALIGLVAWLLQLSS
jgi:hypothetical protein